MKTTLYICITLLLAALAACTGKFEDYNTDKTGFTDEKQQYDFNNFGIPLQVAQQGVYFNYDWGGGKNWTFQVMQNLSADMFCGYMHSYNPYAAGQSNTVYNLNDGWNSTFWEYTYGYTMSAIKQAEDLTRDKVPPYYAIAKIIKVMAMHRVSDYYGPVVYTTYGGSVTGSAPDSQKAAYYAFFSDLEEAIKTLKDLNDLNDLSDFKDLSDNAGFARFDMWMHEDRRTYRQWLRFANSLRLRLAIRIAMADPAKAKEEAAKAFALPGGLLEDYNDIVAVSTNATGYTNPLGEINREWHETCMNANMESILKGYRDPRLSRFFNPATGTGYEGEYRGIRQGTGFNNTLYRNHSTLTTRQTTDAVLMTPAEVWFLRAEAALRGWTAENAGDCYRKGVEASLVQWGIGNAAEYLENDATAADFIDTFEGEYNIGARCLVSPRWEEAATDEVKLEKIITQKWIACFPEGCEAWAEQRRTGYPHLFPVLLNMSEGKIDTDIMIRRLNFPVGIKTSDPLQYDALCRELGAPDNGGSRLWWDTGRNF